MEEGPSVSECYNHLFDVNSLHFRSLSPWTCRYCSYLTSLKGLKVKGAVRGCWDSSNLCCLSLASSVKGRELCFVFLTTKRLKKKENKRESVCTGSRLKKISETRWRKIQTHQHADLLIRPEPVWTDILSFYQIWVVVWMELLWCQLVVY